jgi:hypothetical protein
MNSKIKPTSIEPSSRISQQTNAFARALKTTQSNHSSASIWSNLMPKLCSSKFPNTQNSKTGRSQTPQPKNLKNKSKVKNSKIFSSSHKRKAKIVFNTKKNAGKLLKFKGTKRERSKNLSTKKTEKGWLKSSKMKKSGGEYCYFNKKSRSKSKIGKTVSKSPTSFRQKNFCSIPKNSKRMKQNLKMKEHSKKKKMAGKDLKMWKLKTDFPGTLKGSSSSQLRNSSKIVQENYDGNNVKKNMKKGKKAYSKTPKSTPFGLDALKITFEYLSSSKNGGNKSRVGTFMSNTSGGLFSPNNKESKISNKNEKHIKKTSSTFFKPSPSKKLQKNRIHLKNSKVQKLQIKIEGNPRKMKRKIKPASTRVVAKTNFFPSKKLTKMKFCEYNGDTGNIIKKNKEKSAKNKKAEIGNRMYLSKNENVWVDGMRKDWKGFSTCKNYITKSKHFFGGSNLFGGRFHKEEKLVAEIVGVNKRKHYKHDDPDYGLKKSKTYKKGRKLSESLKKGSLRAKGKALKMSRVNKDRVTKDTAKKRNNNACRSNSRNSEILIAQRLKRVEKRVSPKVSPVDRTLEARFIPRRGGQINREQNDNNTTFQQGKQLTDRINDN